MWLRAGAQKADDTGSVRALSLSRCVIGGIVYVLLA